MQKLEFANKKSTLKIQNATKQVEESKVIENLREVKGAGLATSHNVFRLLGTDVYYVQSERSDNIYYFCKFKPDVLESSWYCSCKDNSIRHLKCKHMFTIEFAIKWGTIKEIDKNFAGDIIDQSTTNDKVAIATKSVIVASRTPKSYLDDDYDF